MLNPATSLLNSSLNVMFTSTYMQDKTS